MNHEGTLGSHTCHLIIAMSIVNQSFSLCPKQQLCFLSTWLQQFFVVGGDVTVALQSSPADSTQVPLWKICPPAQTPRMSLPPLEQGGDFLGHRRIVFCPLCNGASVTCCHHHMGWGKVSGQVASHRSTQLWHHPVSSHPNNKWQMVPNTCDLWAI